MKKVFVIAASLLLSVGVFAQKSSRKKHKTVQKVAVDRDGFKKINGQMMVLTNGTPEIMVKAQTLPNGMRILTNGQVKNASGETTKLENGDFLDLEGNLKTKDKTARVWNTVVPFKAVADSVL